MGYLRSVERSSLFNEFSKDEQKKYFSLSCKKIIPHVDTLYYSVFIKNDNVEADEELISIRDFIETLNFLKSQFDDEELKYDRDFWLNEEKGLLFSKSRFSIYDYCISKKGYYDIFISSYLPNDSTPRIVIQLRSIGLWTIGEYDLVLESYNVVKDILSDYDLEIEKTQENRIDFCYHTNILENPELMYNDDSLMYNLHTTFDIYSKVGRKHGKELTVEYLSLGQRSSNNIFFRSYNKVREVIEENYKEFFLEYWYNSKLINYYDYFVYSYAFKKKKYSQIYFGIIEFYLKFGNDQNIKDGFLYIKEHPKEFTVHDLKKIVLDVCPKPTLIMNIEFQCMRKFFYSFNNAIEIYKPAIQSECSYVQLLRVFQILDNRKLFLDYLTEHTVSFQRNLSDDLLKDLYKNDTESIYLDFWKRIRSVKIPLCFNGRIRRSYIKNINKDLIVSRIKSSLATLSLYNDNWDTDFQNDLSSLICILNDNDVVRNDDGTFAIIDKEYENIKEKKKKALKSIISNSRPSEK